MSRVCALYHVVFRTKYREKVIVPAIKRELYSVIWDIVKKQNCFLYRIGGIEDHVHMLVELQPAISLATFVKHVKGSSSHWLRHASSVRSWRGWSRKYFALTYSYADKDVVINYIKNQEEHHKTHTWRDELFVLAQQSGQDVSTWLEDDDDADDEENEDPTAD